MNSRELAALICSIISHLLLILFLLFPPSIFLSVVTDSSADGNLIPVVADFLSTSAEIAAALPLLSVSRKRKRTCLPDDDDGDDDAESELSHRDSGVPRSPDSFRVCFKMTAATFEWLAGLLEPLLDCRDPVDSPLNLPPETRLGIGLFRFATGADYPEVATRFGVPITAAKFCVRQLCRVLCTNFRFWVGFPNPNEVQPVSSSFETLTGLPNCCGIIACTRFKIKPKNSGEDIGEDSISTQIVVDSGSRILNIVAGFHGRKNNFQVLKSSSLYQDIKSKNLLNSTPLQINAVEIPQYFVGDKGYPLLPWLLTPFLNPISGSNEEKFNVTHQLMRQPLMKTIASLKNWGVLSRPIEGEFKVGVGYIGSIAILHNVLLMREDYSALSEGLLEKEEEESAQVKENWGEDESEKAAVIRSVLSERASVFPRS